MRQLTAPGCSILRCDRRGTMAIVLWSAATGHLVAVPVCPGHFDLHPTRNDYQKLPSW